MHYVIGDVHNNIKELQNLIIVIQPGETDTLCFLGDLIDKNTGTEECITYITQLCEEFSVVILKGNHDYVWEKYLLEEEVGRQDFLLHFGSTLSLSEFEDGEEALRGNDISRLKSILAPYLNLVGSMKPYVIIDGFIIIHGGLLPEQLTEDPLKVREINYFLRPEEMNKNDKYLDRYRVVAGHTVLGEEPSFNSGYINIDTGAGYGAFISCYFIEEHTVIRSDGKIFPDTYM